LTNITFEFSLSKQRVKVLNVRSGHSDLEFSTKKGNGQVTSAKD